MSNLNQLTKAELIDLITAYDSYIATAADAGRLKTGWVPVCVSEFYSCEYQDVWRAGESFDYMYGYDELEQQSVIGYLIACNDARIFMENGRIMCLFDGEEEKRFVRSRIQEICDGDAFFIGTGLHYADGDAHQNMDEKDASWIVYDVGGDSWFEEDIGDPKACIEAIVLSQRDTVTRKPTLESVVQSAEKTASQRPAGPSKPFSRERQ